MAKKIINQEVEKRVVRPIEIIQQELDKLDNSYLLKLIKTLLVASIILEIIVIMLSTKHVAYVLNTFSIESIGVTHRINMWKQWGTYGAMGFEFALSVVLVGSMIGKKYNTYNWKNTVSVLVFLFVNFIGNMYFVLMLYPHLHPVETDGTHILVSNGELNLQPLTEYTIGNIDLIYWVLSITMFGVLPVMSWVLMNQSYSFLLAQDLAQDEINNKRIELIKELDESEDRRKKSESQKERRAQEKQGKKTMTFGEYSKQSEQKDA